TTRTDDVVENLIRWADQQDLVRAVVLTSSRAIPNAPVDLFSDYDVILSLPSIEPFHADRTWLEVFGPVLAVYRDPLIDEDGLVRSAYVVQYENGLKIDFNLWPVELLERVAKRDHIIAEFDAGYQVLLDKDGLTIDLKPPTYSAYIPTPPTEAHYFELLEGFFLDTTYVAKFLWRDDVMAAKHILDHSLKQEHLRPMLEWRVEIDHGWSVKPGSYGRGLKKWLRPDLWTELENTYTGLEPEANWTALFKTIALFRKVALEVGQQLGYAYSHDLDRRVMAYLDKVKNLDHNAKSIF
ncbi:MAG TPA: aminoglycoside 6-adenylyltransferase, partial [Anaerolineae bacterium]|nr:aminoglycoside 6-adenylyltransferase [Anaerolineae bacterium]